VIAHPTIGPRLVQVKPGSWVNPADVTCVTIVEGGGVELRLRNDREPICWEQLDDFSRMCGLVADIAHSINQSLEAMR
jgi:hypothetical protein